MIDNFLEILPLIEFNDDWIYVITIMTRHKDFGLNLPEKAQKHRIIREYYVESKDYFCARYSEIQKLCQFFNARAYINLNPKPKSKLGLELLDQLTKKLKAKDTQYLNLLPKALGNVGSPKRTWVVDVDNPDQLEQIIYTINELPPVVDNKIIKTLPTVNGRHIISTPFDLKRFSQLFPEVDVQKNSPTLLYFAPFTLGE